LIALYMARAWEPRYGEYIRMPATSRSRVGGGGAFCGGAGGFAFEVEDDPVCQGVQDLTEVEVAVDALHGQGYVAFGEVVESGG
jgi:hypothetical protein